MTLQTSQLPFSTPEAQGISSAAISSFVDKVNQTIHELHSFILVRHGHIVSQGWWAPYSAHRPHTLFSLSKSFTSSAIGLAVAEGRLSVDDKVLSFFPEDAPANPGPNLAAMRVRDLLCMSTGHAVDTTSRMVRRKDGNWIKGFLSLPVKRQPGSFFVYNSGATFMLSAIVQKLTGQTVLDYLKPRLFDPLGIQDPTWETNPQGISVGGWGLSIKTDDIARFGQLYLQKGKWNGQQILPEAWVTQATSPQAPFSSGGPDWQQGYGYQFWRCRHNAYRGDGAFGQYCIVLPDQDAVLAITSSVNDMQSVLNLVWEILLPAMQPGALPENKSACEAMVSSLSSLTLLPPAGDATSPTAAKVSGKSYKMEANPMKVHSLRFDFSPSGCNFTVQSAQGESRLACGAGKWVEGVSDLMDPAPKPATASGAWTSADTYTITLRYHETPFIYSLACCFYGDRLVVNTGLNLSLRPANIPQLNGKLA